jgi:hypothetical protein
VYAIIYTYLFKVNSHICVSNDFTSELMPISAFSLRKCPVLSLLNKNINSNNNDNKQVLKVLVQPSTGGCRPK